MNQMDINWLGVGVFMLFHNIVVAEIDNACVQLLTKQQANNFLTSGQLTPVECCDESPCERRGSQCYTETLRQHIVTTVAGDRGWTCPTGQSIKVTSWCVGHYRFDCSDICDTLGVNRCKNGGTCIHDNSNQDGWACKCVPGYTGRNCETDINECASNPCQNGATCEDRINSFHCICPDRIYGVLCDTNICHPTPADIVFVLDSSISMLERQFQKQLQFIANFTDHVHVGPRDFQISVITFSTESHVEFYLNEYSDNVTLKEALGRIKFKPGVTFTDKGLEKVATVFSSGGRGIERIINGTRADRFVYLLTDGMSNDRQRTQQKAADLRHNYDVTIAAVGIGLQVSHTELLGVASSPELVYSLANFNSLDTVLKMLVHHTCDECIQSSRSDVSVIVDATRCTRDDDFPVYLNILHQLVDVMDLSGDTRISLSTFDDTLEEVISLGSSTSSSIKAAVNRLEHTKRSACLNITSALEMSINKQMDSKKNDSRNFLIFLTSGFFLQTQNASYPYQSVAPESVTQNGIQIVALANSLNDVNNIAGLLQLTQDPFNVFLVDPDPDVLGQSLSVLKSSFTYNKCDLKGE